MSRAKLPTDEIEFIREAYAAQLPLSEIAAALGKTADAVKCTATRHGMRITTRGPEDEEDYDETDLRRIAWMRARLGAKKALEGFK